jgi:hypothetical protein
MSLFVKATFIPILIYLTGAHVLKEIDFYHVSSPYFEFIVIRLYVYIPIVLLFRWFGLSWIEVLISLILIYILRQTVDSPLIAIAIVLAKTHWQRAHTNP